MTWNSASEDIDFDSDKVPNVIMWKIASSGLWSAVIGQYNNVIDFS